MYHSCRSPHRLLSSIYLVTKSLLSHKEQKTTTVLMNVGWCDHLRCLEKGFIKISNTCCTVCLHDIEKTWGNEIPWNSREFKTHVSVPNRRNWNSASIWGVCVSKDSSQMTMGWIAEKTFYLVLLVLYRKLMFFLLCLIYHRIPQLCVMSLS